MRPTFACQALQAFRMLDFKRVTSSLGFRPKARLDSRLNWDVLSYPTSRQAADAGFSSRSISRRAWCKRTDFRYCIGEAWVTVRECT